MNVYELNWSGTGMVRQAAIIMAELPSLPLACSRTDDSACAGHRNCVPH